MTEQTGKSNTRPKSSEYAQRYAKSGGKRGRGTVHSVNERPSASPASKRDETPSHVQSRKTSWAGRTRTCEARKIDRAQRKHMFIRAPPKPGPRLDSRVQLKPRHSPQDRPGTKPTSPPQSRNPRQSYLAHTKKHVCTDTSKVKPARKPRGIQGRTEPECPVPNVQCPTREVAAKTKKNSPAALKARIPRTPQRKPAYDLHAKLNVKTKAREGKTPNTRVPGPTAQKNEDEDTGRKVRHREEEQGYKRKRNRARKRRRATTRTSPLFCLYSR
ncbi:hypothetical protein C8R45DRAFT_946433 [Mycena sanguinolenta]|nr:hypothetical protein C8R45DRAFT_946433 [Mycena sanguinolenta]